MENGPPKWLLDGWTLFRGIGGLSSANWGEIGQKLKRPTSLFDLTRRRLVLTNWCWYENLAPFLHRVIVKLSVGNDGSVSLSENCVRVVGKEEYKKFSRVINKDAYEEYAKKQQEREIQWDKDGRKNGHDERNGDSNSQRESKSKKSSRRSPDRDSLKRRR